MLRITLEYKGIRYHIQDEFSEWTTDENNNPVEGDCFIWTDGNYSCDCNRALFIQRVGFPDFPDMECGDAIKLVSIK